ncbi:MAG TPA: signal peptidase I [Candidatus Angelobacter sp.]|nr:signal peptidase I [Candidatus Angelobacter sp.]
MFAKNKDQNKEKKKETFPEFIAGILAVLVSAIFIITFVIQAFEIPSGSMENTLLIGDHVFVDRLTPMHGGILRLIMPYREIRHGDIIVFVHPKDPGTYVVKRVIGLPGDRIHLKDGVVYRNGEPLTEPYLLGKSTGVEFRENFPRGVPDTERYPEWPMQMRAYLRDGDLLVPPDNYFGMGDHRDVSLDSRYWGFIPRENIVGRPLFIYWSFDTPSDQEERKGTSERIDFILHVVAHFFDKTRWGRMFHLVR